ncbi:transcriptional regulator, IclR family [Alteribacillus persepolensis]|uniref:Glycerol operon regulatory protein n=1 Tax=Alteribacillus persepolensis TaxID=568899 RepID=A0A1G8A922_9BACI|nr:IclR family transcriptional regulator [Alteribacillus persepolensis]SDH17429.1 transcriptional regulator, IclR family [Alteribacillus persepolensis]
MQNSTTRDKYRLSSVRNAMKILQLYKHSSKKDFGVAEIARHTGLPKSTAHRLISTLRKEGFLSQHPRTGQYRLGLSLLTLGGVVSVHKEIYKDAFPILESLVKDIGETCHICLLEKEQVVYFYRVKRKNPERLITDIGRKNPIHCTSEGLVLLAYQEEAFVDHIIEQGLHRYTDNTITDGEHLKETLHKIREQGYAVSKEQYFPNYAGIAVPIRDYSSNVVSSLATIGPTTRISENSYNRYINTLKHTARDISEELGYFGS